METKTHKYMFTIKRITDVGNAPNIKELLQNNKIQPGDYITLAKFTEDNEYLRLLTTGTAYEKDGIIFRNRTPIYAVSDTNKQPIWSIQDDDIIIEIGNNLYKNGSEELYVPYEIGSGGNDTWIITPVGLVHTANKIVYLNNSQIYDKEWTEMLSCKDGVIIVSDEGFFLNGTELLLPFEKESPYVYGGNYLGVIVEKDKMLVLNGKTLLYESDKDYEWITSDESPHIFIQEDEQVFCIKDGKKHLVPRQDDDGLFDITSNEYGVIIKKDDELRLYPFLEDKN